MLTREVHAAGKVAPAQGAADLEAPTSRWGARDHRSPPCSLRSDRAAALGLDFRRKVVVTSAAQPVACAPAAWAAPALPSVVGGREVTLARDRLRRAIGPPRAVRAARVDRAPANVRVSVVGPAPEAVPALAIDRELAIVQAQATDPAQEIAPALVTGPSVVVQAWAIDRAVVEDLESATVRGPEIVQAWAIDLVVDVPVVVVPASAIVRGPVVVRVLEIALVAAAAPESATVRAVEIVREWVIALVAGAPVIDQVGIDRAGAGLELAIDPVVDALAQAIVREQAIGPVGIGPASVIDLWVDVLRVVDPAVDVQAVAGPALVIAQVLDIARAVRGHREIGPWVAPFDLCDHRMACGGTTDGADGTIRGTADGIEAAGM